MQTLIQIAPQAGASGHSPLFPLASAQPNGAAGAHGDDFTATLAADDVPDGDLGPALTSAMPAEALSPALLASGIGLHWSVAAASAAAVGGDTADPTEVGPDRDATSGGRNPSPGFVWPDLSGPAAQVVVARGTDPGSLDADAEDAPAPRLSGDTAAAPRAVVAAMLPGASAGPLSGAADRSGPALQGLASPDTLPDRAAGSSGQPDKPPQPGAADLSGAAQGTVAPVKLQADAARRAADATMPDERDAATARPDGAAVGKSLVVKRARIGADPVSKKATQAEPDPQSPDDQKATKAAGPRDTGPGRHLACAETRVLAAASDNPAQDHLRVGESPASAAESLWHGAALARISAGLAPQAGVEALPATGVGVLWTPEAGRPRLLPAADAHYPPSLPPVPANLPDLEILRRADMPLAMMAPVPAGPGAFFPAAVAFARSDMLALVDADGLSDKELAASAGIPAGATPGQPLAVTGQPAGMQPAPTLAHMSAHVVAALARHPEGVTDIALSPEELGRVQMTLHADAQNPDRMVVFLNFDRPETLDLFRRHADQLAEAIRTAGYSGVDINFGQSGASAGDGFSPGAGGAETPKSDALERPATLSTNLSQDAATHPGGLGAPHPGAAVALDLRL